MYYKAKILFISLLVQCLNNYCYSQFNFGISTGYSRTWGENIQNKYKNNLSIGARFLYINNSSFQPILDIEFASISLKNGFYIQNYYQGTVDPTFTSTQISVSNFIPFNKSQETVSGVIFGIGMSNFYNNQLKFNGTLNGINSNGPHFEPNQQLSEWLPFITLSYSGYKRLNNHLLFQMQVGMQYYLSSDIINVTYTYWDDYSNQYTIDVNEKIQPFRPFVKFSFLYGIVGKKKEILNLE